MSLTNALGAVRTRGISNTLIAALRAGVARIARLRGRRFVERNILSYRMLLDLDDRGISRTLLLFRQRELEHKIMLERVLRPGMSVLDIGANIGYYALMELALVLPGGSLIAVEPSPSNAALLKRNLALNGYTDVEIHQVAISDQATTRPFFISEMSNLNTFHRTGSAAHLKGETLDVETTTVPVIMQSRPLDLIRMDVEGHEIEVLKGLLPAIESGQMRPMVIFETHLSRYTPEHAMEPVLRRLFANGYRVTMAASTSQRGTRLVEALGYKGSDPIVTDDVERVIYEHIKNEDAIDLICRTGGMRTVLMAPA
jgi:FkbM family methyltransferase